MIFLLIDSCCIIDFGVINKVKKTMKKVLFAIAYLTATLVARQKVDIKSLDSDAKKNAASQAAAVKSQTDAIKKNTDSDALERYKAQERANAAKQTETDRFKLLEDGLRQVRDDRANEVKAEADARSAAAKKAAEDHDDLMRALRNSFIGVIAALISALILYLVKATAGQAQIAGLIQTSDHIKGLVNSTYTAALQGRLDANKVALAALQEVNSSAERHGEKISQTTLVLIDESRKSITELEITLSDRLRVK